MDDDTLTGHELLDREGAAVGKVTDVIADPATLEAEWAVVKMGRFGGEHLVPLDVIEEQGELLVLPFTKDAVKDTPAVKDHTPPTPHDADELHRHYEAVAG
jgi:hypothetical protein